MKKLLLGVLIFVMIIVCATISSVLQFREAAKNVSELQYHTEKYFENSEAIQELVFHIERK